MAIKLHKGAILQMSELYNEGYYASACGLDYSHVDHWKPFFQGIAKKIIDSFSPKTVLDVGCAWGYLVEALRDLGVEAYGVDISSYAISKVREDIKPYCTVGSVTDSLPESFPKRYDILITIEMIEHLHEEECMAAIEKLCNYSDKILISSSSDDITEPTHFNVQQAEYWVKRFAKFGFFNRLDIKPTYISKDSFLFEKNDDMPKVVANYEQSIRLLVHKMKLEAEHENKIFSTLFFNTDGSITEENKLHIVNESEKLHYHMDTPSNLRGIRFDPVEGVPCIVENAGFLSDKGYLTAINKMSFESDKKSIPELKDYKLYFQTY
jgi:hypothetical protein